MIIITSLLVGAVIGWLASMLIGTDSREGLIRNVTAGVAGAYIGAWLLRTLSDSVNAGGFSLGAMIASALGAATLVLLMKRFIRS